MKSAPSAGSTPTPCTWIGPGSPLVAGEAASSSPPQPAAPASAASAAVAAASMLRMSTPGRLMSAYARASVAGARHLPAALGAPAAHLGAVAHDLVVAGDLLAGLCAALARLHARAAIRMVQRRAAEHEVAAGVAGLRAVEQRLDVLGVGVLAALTEAVDHRL